MANNILQFSNGRFLSGQQYLPITLLTTVDGNIAPYNTPLIADAEQVDCEGDIVTAAFIDLQKYGGGSLLFAQHPTVEALQALANENAAGGVAHCLVTLPTVPITVAYQAMDAIATYWQQGGKGIAGLHLEGPFINPEKRGAHLLDWIITPTTEMVADLLAHRPGVLKMVTLAPECVSDAVLAAFAKAGVLVSAGHSNATFAQASGFAARGVHLVTHLFNAMSPLHHRDVGLPAAVLLSQYLVASIIPDGIHVAFETLRLAKMMVGERLFYITDAVTPTNKGAYPHQLQGDAYYLPNGTLSGSAISMAQGVQNGVEHADFSLEESICMGNFYPAKAMGWLQTLGTLAPGGAPGLVQLRADWKVKLH